jgi:hypothetical protein
VRSLAQIRLATAELAPESENERRALLLRAAAASHPGVSVYARGELAHRLVEAGELDGALDQLVRVAYDGPTPLHTPHFQDDLDRTLAKIAESAASDDGCLEVVRRLGGRRTLLLAHASAPGAFLGLGDCYLALGVPASALDTYRATSARFGPEVGSALPLHIARASLQAGDLAAVRAALRAERARLEEDANLPVAWRLVAAQLALSEKRGPGLAEAFAALVRSDELAPVQRAQALLVLAQLAIEAPGSEPLARALEDAMREAPEGGSAAVDSLLAESSLYAADVAARTGSPKAARGLYRRAARGLPPGARQARAAYHDGLLESSWERAQEAFAAAGSSDSASGWARLARAELRLARVRLAIGRAGRPAP